MWRAKLMVPRCFIRWRICPTNNSPELSKGTFSLTKVLHDLITTFFLKIRGARERASTWMLIWFLKSTHLYFDKVGDRLFARSLRMKRKKGRNYQVSAWNITSKIIRNMCKSTFCHGGAVESISRHSRLKTIIWLCISACVKKTIYAHPSFGFAVAGDYLHYLKTITIFSDY
jgi:hypothetical protein